MKPVWKILLRFYLLGAGLMDGVTGILLLVSPKSALGYMGVEIPPPAALVYIRYIGAFVGAVGSLYLIGLAAHVLRGDKPLVRITLLQTAVVRGMIAIFTATALLSGQLGPGWVSVPVTDSVLAAVQIAILVAWRAGADV